MEDQFEHDLYNKTFSNQLESDDDEVDTLQQRIKWWMAVFDRGGLIPNNVYDYSFDDLYVLYCKAIDLEMQDLLKTFKDREIIPKKQVKKISVSNNLS